MLTAARRKPVGALNFGARMAILAFPVVDFERHPV